jgi:hypothetical protein
MLFIKDLTSLLQEAMWFYDKKIKDLEIIAWREIKVEFKIFYHFLFWMVDGNVKNFFSLSLLYSSIETWNVNISPSVLVPLKLG